MKTVTAKMLSPWQVDMRPPKKPKIVLECPCCSYEFTEYQLEQHLREGRLKEDEDRFSNIEIWESDDD